MSRLAAKCCLLCLSTSENIRLVLLPPFCSFIHGLIPLRVTHHRRWPVPQASHARSRKQRCHLASSWITVKGRA